MLIATLPGLGATRQIAKIMNEPLVDAVRYNTGNDSPFDTVKETMEAVASITKDRIAYIDIEGRQVRIDNWGYPKYGSKVELNRVVEVELPARIFFRGDTWYDISFVSGKNIFLEQLPQKALGKSQTINIDSEKWQVVGGYLSLRCKEYVRESIRCGFRKFCLSFVETWDDVDEVENEILLLLEEKSQLSIELILKIESNKGWAFANQFSGSADQRENGGSVLRGDKIFLYRLMAARDDLSTNLMEDPIKLLTACSDIINHDPEAILASKIFSSIESGKDMVSAAEVLEILAHQYVGYKHFMLSDTVSFRHFDKAIEIWKSIQELHRKE